MVTSCALICPTCVPLESLCRSESSVVQFSKLLSFTFGHEFIAVFRPVSTWGGTPVRETAMIATSKESIVDEVLTCQKESNADAVLTHHDHLTALQCNLPPCFASAFAR